MDENEVIPFGSERSRELLRMRQQGGLMPPAQPMDAPASSQDLIRFGTPQSRQMLEGRVEPPRDYTLSEIPLAAIQNLPRSAAGFYGGMVEAITSPIDTLTAMWDMGAGALRAATPTTVRGLIDRLDRDPAAAERATEAAKAAGDFYAERYGTLSGIKRSLAEDPVGVAADFSTIMSGGAMAAGRSPQLAAGLQRAADLTNPVMPLTQAVQGRVPFTERTVPEMVGVGVGSLMDVVSGDAGRTLARNIARESLGPDNVLRAQQMATPQFDRLTTGEAAVAAGIFSPELQALQTIAAERNPQVYGQLRRESEAGRQGLLAAVTPDETAARTARTEAADPLYRAARDPSLPVNTRPIITNIDAILKANPGDTQLRSALNDVKKGLRKSKTAEQLASVDNNIRRLLATKDNAFIQSNLMDIRGQINDAIPGMQQARQTFAEMSAPVNQATVLNEMQRRLTGPMDQERPGQFMRVLGEGEEALIKRSTGAPRFQEGDLMRILSEEQGQAVTTVSDQLRRQAEMQRQASEGMSAMRQILAENEAIPLRAPNVLNRTIMIFNRAMRALSGKVSRTTMENLDQAMRSGQDFNALLNSVPASERSAVIQAMSRFGSDLSADKLRNIGLMGTLAEETEEPFRAELRGMAQ
jgi:hypothetical protein